ncbi:hypothetical protein FXO38_01625 [Capsicum annuum]|nr:hypothetical protein FXO38_01625 [Capsicum annuum]
MTERIAPVIRNVDFRVVTQDLRRLKCTKSLAGASLSWCTCDHEATDAIVIGQQANCCDRGDQIRPLSYVSKQIAVPIHPVNSLQSINAPPADAAMVDKNPNIYFRLDVLFECSPESSLWKTRREEDTVRITNELTMDAEVFGEMEIGPSFSVAASTTATVLMVVVIGEVEEDRLWMGRVNWHEVLSIVPIADTPN